MTFKLSLAMSLGQTLQLQQQQHPSRPHSAGSSFSGAGGSAVTTTAGSSLHMSLDGSLGGGSRLPDTASGAGGSSCKGGWHAKSYSVDLCQAPVLEGVAETIEVRHVMSKHVNAPFCV